MCRSVGQNRCAVGDGRSHSAVCALDLKPVTHVFKSPRNIRPARNARLILPTQHTDSADSAKLNFDDSC